MPPRWIVGSIIAFWLVSAGWLFWREIGVRYFLEQPPLLSIDIGDEATTSAPETLWTLLRAEKDGEEKEIGTALTRLKYHPENDTFELMGQMKQLKLDFPILGVGNLEVQVPELLTSNRVTREGIIRETSANGSFTVGIGLGGVTLPGMSMRMDIHGIARDQQIHWRGTIASNDKITGGWEIRPTIAPTPVPSGSVLNPMQPLNRIRDLRAGQQWEQTMIDPIADALQASLPQMMSEMTKMSGMKSDQLPKFDLPISIKPVLRARVLSEIRELTWREVTDRCRIIEYRAGEELVGRTWVAVDDERVLRQEAFQSGETLSMQREDTNRSGIKK